MGLVDRGLEAGRDHAVAGGGVVAEEHHQDRDRGPEYGGDDLRGSSFLFRYGVRRVSYAVVQGRSVGEAFDVDVLAGDAAGDDGLLRSIHPPRAAADEHVVVGEIRHELAQRLGVTEVRRVLR